MKLQHRFLKASDGRPESYKIDRNSSDLQDSERRQFARDVLARVSGAVMSSEQSEAFADEVQALLNKYGITDGQFWTRKLGDNRWSFRIEGTMRLTGGKIVECLCGSDNNDGMPRLAIVCPKHDL